MATDPFPAKSAGGKKQTLLFLAVLFILVGTLLTLENCGLIGGVSHHWPVFLVVTGCGFILLFFKRVKADDALLWLGTFIMILGLFFYYLNFTSWQKLASLWPAFLGVVGLSFLSVGAFKGKKFFLYFAVFFLALYLVLTLVFTVSKRLWPLSFLVFGLCLLVLEGLRRRMMV